MRFEEALKIMKDGNKVKLPSWGGFWKWDSEKERKYHYAYQGRRRTGHPGNSSS